MIRLKIEELQPEILIHVNEYNFASEENRKKFREYYEEQLKKQNEKEEK